MVNLTADEMLDSVATTFKGVVLYGECKQPNGSGLFKLDYIIRLLTEIRTKSRPPGVRR